MSSSLIRQANSGLRENLLHHLLICPTYKQTHHCNKNADETDKPAAALLWHEVVQLELVTLHQLMDSSKTRLKRYTKKHQGNNRKQCYNKMTMRKAFTTNRKNFTDLVY